MPLNFQPLNFDPGRGEDAAGAPVSRSSPAHVIACLAVAGAAFLTSAVLFAAAQGRERRMEALPPLRGSDAPAAAVGPAPAAPAPIAAPKQASRSPARPDPDARFLANLRSAGPGVVTFRIEDDPAAWAYARQLAALFRTAGWRVEVEGSFGAAEPVIGLAAALGHTPQDEALERAFAAAGVSLSPPPLAGLFRTPVLLVGLPPG